MSRLRRKREKEKEEGGGVMTAERGREKLRLSPALNEGWRESGDCGISSVSVGRRGVGSGAGVGRGDESR